mmetsp:Transcript_44333/g.71019  ORF Transcript_44333/g.71019 Transcript_44333/m.71019 type:complete len:298 (+) Transcript_44333:1612-2505(+)
MDITNPSSLDISVEGFAYYALVVIVVIYSISFAIEFILKRVSSLEHLDVSLISRRIATISIHFVVLLLLLQAIYVMYTYNRFFHDNLPRENSYEFWNHNKIPKQFEDDSKKIYFFLTKTDITYEGYKQSKLLLQIVMTINGAFNGIDMYLMYFHGKGFSAESSSLLMFHHWTMIWIESCIFNLELLNVHPDWNWMFAIIGLILVVGCIADLLLSPSTIKCFISNEKSMIYKKLLWLHLLFNIVLLRGCGVSMLAFEFIVTLWQMDWKYGAAFQVAMIFMWLQWNNLGKAIWHKISTW